MNESSRNLPDFNQLSVLTAAVLLAYALAQLVETQRTTMDFSLLGVIITLPINLTTISILLAAGLTATGTDWLLRSHPRFEHTSTFQHWLLPALAALAIGVPLYNLPQGITWWISFGLGGIILLIVFIAEYIVVDPSDLRYPTASATLISLSFALFIILTATLGYTGSRLLLIVTVVFPAAALVSLRALQMRLSRWEFSWAIGIGIIAIHLAAALHYWPLLPIQYGLALLGPVYAATGLASNLAEKVSPRQAWIEAGIALAACWGAALVFQI